MQFGLSISSLLAIGLIASKAQACLHFTATRSANRPIWNMEATVVDNGQQMCAYNSDSDSCGGCGRWGFVCIAANIATTVYLQDDGSSLLVNYAVPWGEYDFVVPMTSGGLFKDEVYEAWMYC